MASIQVRVLDVSGSRICDVEAPDDVTVDRILVLMVEKMGLPLNSPDGQLMSYKLHHRRSGTQLLDNQTLLGAGVKAGDELRLQPEITAGAALRFTAMEIRTQMPQITQICADQFPSNLRLSAFQLR